jgi:hypothetical protein
VMFPRPKVAAPVGNYCLIRVDLEIPRGKYNKLKKSSMLFITPHDSRTIKHIDVNAAFFQMEFGINAGLPRRS